MTTTVTVDEQIFDLLWIRTVGTLDGEIKEIPPGQPLEPTDELLVMDGEPTFAVRLAHVVRTDADVPDEVGLALRKVVQRLPHVMEDGREDPGDVGPAGWVYGPAVHDGAVVIHIDTDGAHAGPATIDTMTHIFVEELAPLGIRAHIVAAPNPAVPLLDWRSSDERPPGVDLRSRITDRRCVPTAGSIR